MIVGKSEILIAYAYSYIRLIKFIIRSGFALISFTQGYAHATINYGEWIM